MWTLIDNILNRNETEDLTLLFILYVRTYLSLLAKISSLWSGTPVVH